MACSLQAIGVRLPRAQAREVSKGFLSLFFIMMDARFGGASVPALRKQSRHRFNAAMMPLPPPDVQMQKGSSLRGQQAIYLHLVDPRFEI